MTPVVHLVAEIVDGVQACLRCGEIIIDYRGAIGAWYATETAIVGTHNPLQEGGGGYAPGPVTTFEHGSAAGAAEGGEPCRPLETN